MFLGECDEVFIGAFATEKEAEEAMGKAAMDILEGRYHDDMLPDVCSVFALEEVFAWALHSLERGAVVGDLPEIEQFAFYEMKDREASAAAEAAEEVSVVLHLKRRGGDPWL